MSARIKKIWQQQIKKRNKSAEKNNSQEFTIKNLYIMPSSFGWLFGFVLITISTGAINYQLNPAFLLFFLLVVLGCIAIWETHFNLNGLIIQCLPINDTEQGQPAKISLLLKSEAPKRQAIYFKFEGEEEVKLEGLPSGTGHIIVPIVTKKRGKFSLPTLKVYSFYPIGILKVWGYASFSKEYFVYPRPEDPGFFPNPTQARQKSSSPIEKIGEDELYDLKSVANPWTQPGRIAWKISARGEGWYVKTMSSPVATHWLFSLQDLPTKNVEQNLQFLAYWLFNAEAQGHLYGLELKGKQTELAHGEEHLKNCLRQLAMY